MRTRCVQQSVASGQAIARRRRRRAVVDPQTRTGRRSRPAATRRAGSWRPSVRCWPRVCAACSVRSPIRGSCKHRELRRLTAARGERLRKGGQQLRGKASCERVSWEHREGERKRFTERKRFADNVSKAHQTHTQPARTPDTGSAPKDTRCALLGRVRLVAELAPHALRGQSRDVVLRQMVIDRGLERKVPRQRQLTSQERQRVGHERQRA